MKRRCAIKWFKHDSNANMDAKLQEVLLEYGAEGYGLYWYCIELIAGGVDSNNITFELEHDARIIGRNLGLGVQRVQDIMTKMIDLGLFENSNGIITCFKLARRLDDTNSKNPEIKNIVNKINGSEKIGVSPKNSSQIRLDKTRLDKKRKDIGGRFTPPELEEVSAYCKERKNSVDPAQFIDHYTANGWHVGKNKMKDWKASVRTWERTNEARKQSGKPTADQRLEKLRQWAED